MPMPKAEFTKETCFAVAREPPYTISLPTEPEHGSGFGRFDITDQSRTHQSELRGDSWRRRGDRVRAGELTTLVMLGIGFVVGLVRRIVVDDQNIAH